MGPEFSQQRHGTSDLRLIIGANLFVLALIAMCQAAYAILF